MQTDIQPYPLLMLALLRPDADDAVELQAVDSHHVHQWVTFGRGSISCSEIGQDAG